jgi:citrate synthase
MATVNELVAQALQIPLSSVTDDLEYQSITAWDSVRHIELMLVLEEALGLTIDADQVLQLSSVGKIRKFVEERHGAPPQAPPPPKEVSEGPKIHRGLNNVYFDQSTITAIDGENGHLRHRGYPIHELAEHCRFEEIIYLLLRGELPTSAELADLDKELISYRVLPPQVVEMIGLLRESSPTDVLRSAVSALSGFDPDRNNHDTPAQLRKGLRLLSHMAMVVATHARLRAGRSVTSVDPKLNHAANFLYMLTAETPPEWLATYLDRDFILHADHGANASTFTARVVTGTQADLHAAVTAAIAAFSGPLHGGAAGDVMKMIEEVGSPQNAATWVRRKQQAGQPVTGFGHRVYRTADPRARYMRHGCEALANRVGTAEIFATLQAVIDAMEPYCRHGVAPNVDLYGGVIYHFMGLPADLAVPIFAMGRVAGWVAQIVEQRENNVLIRPRLQYAGAAPRSVTPLAQRA